MIHAKIVEDLRPDQAESGDALEQCAKRLSSTDWDYLRRRADQEAEAAQGASCSEARLAHAEMAEAYRSLLLARERSPQSDLPGLD